MAQYSRSGVILPPIQIPLLLSLTAFLLAPLWFPAFRLLAFAPLLAIACKRTSSYSAALWIGLSIGFVNDLFNTSLPFGLFSLTYTLLAATVYLYRKWFFEENPLSLCLFVALISWNYSWLEFVVFPLFHRPLPLSFAGTLSHFLWMPLLDSLFAFFWFCVPMMGYTVFKKREKG